MIEFTKIKFSKVLPKTKNSIVFNPAVCHWKKDLYLCSYREFIRYDGLDTKKFEKNPLTNPNHPWLGSDKAYPVWWKSVYGHDYTKLVLLSINKNLDVHLVKDFGHVEGQDARLFKIDKNRFIFTANVYPDNITIKNNLKCGDGIWCTSIASRIIELKNGSCYKSKETILCPSISNRIEKNWSLWKTPRNKLKFSYGLVPHHEVYNLKITEDKVECSGVKKTSGKNDFFKRLRNYYDDIIYVSLSTPALRQPNGKYLGVGHVKYRYHVIDDDEKISSSNPNQQKPDNKFNLDIKHEKSPLVKFHKRMVKEGKKFHPALVYLMFLYEFNSTSPYNITRISPMFIPNSEYTLCFPDNLTFSSDLNAYIISYGDYDSQCNMLVMTQEEVDQSLGPIPKPKNLQFLMVN